MSNDVYVAKCPYYNIQKCQSTAVSNMTTRRECKDFRSLIQLEFVGLTACGYIHHMNKVMFCREMHLI